MQEKQKKQKVEIGKNVLVSGTPADAKERKGSKVSNPIVTKKTSGIWKRLILEKSCTQRSTCQV